MMRHELEITDEHVRGFMLLDDSLSSYSGKVDESGKAFGYGTATYSNKRTYTGLWRDNTPHGEGTISTTCWTFSGHFMEGRAHGPSVFTNGDCKAEGLFVNGIPHGEFYVSFNKQDATEAYGEVKFINDGENIQVKVQTGNWHIRGLRISKFDNSIFNQYLGQTIEQPTKSNPTIIIGGSSGRDWFGRIISLGGREYKGTWKKNPTSSVFNMYGDYSSHKGKIQLDSLNIIPLTGSGSFIDAAENIIEGTFIDGAGDCTIRFKSGDIWKGHVINGLIFDGQGEFFDSSTHKTCVGVFCAGKPISAKGFFRYSQTSTIEGDWSKERPENITQDDFIIGKVTLIKEKNMYIGEIDSQFKPNGKGSNIEIDEHGTEKVIFEGKFKNGLAICGTGIAQITNFVTIEATWKPTSGSGKVIDKRNGIFTGEWAISDVHKIKKHISPTDKVEQFMATMQKEFLIIDGKGEYLKNNGDRYVGTWKRTNGSGIIYFQNGNVIRGKWDSKFRYYGKCQLSYLDKIYFIGRFKHSLPETGEGVLSLGKETKKKIFEGKFSQNSNYNFTGKISPLNNPSIFYGSCKHSVFSEGFVEIETILNNSKGTVVNCDGTFVSILNKGGSSICFGTIFKNSFFSNFITCRVIFCISRNGFRGVYERLIDNNMLEGRKTELSVNCQILIASSAESSFINKSILHLWPCGELMYGERFNENNRYNHVGQQTKKVFGWGVDNKIYRYQIGSLNSQIIEKSNL